MAPSIFVSHSHVDNDWCQGFVSTLKNMGIDVWYDEQGLSAGDQWRRVIEQQIELREIFILILSPEALQSEWVHRELDLALALNHKIIPVVYKPTTITGFLRTIQYVDAVNMNFVDAGHSVANKLTPVIQEHYAAPSPLPTPSNIPTQTIRQAPKAYVADIEPTKKIAEQLLNDAQKYWAANTMSVSDAIDAGLVPPALQWRLPKAMRDRLVCVVRMHIASYIASVMTKEDVSFEEMVARLKSDSYYYPLCKFIEGKNQPLPHAQWVQTQAPLYGGGKILYPWSGNRNRQDLIPALAKAVSLGVVRNGTATDHLTFMRQVHQREAFIYYCETRITDQELRNIFPK